MIPHLKIGAKMTQPVYLKQTKAPKKSLCKY